MGLSVEEIDSIDRFRCNVNLILMLDHGGRAGSNFFQCLFDAHQECIVCPLVHYVYSYWFTLFSDRDFVSASEAHDFIANKSYAKYLYHDPVGDYLKVIRKIGGDETAPFDRNRFRNLIDTLVSGDGVISRKEAIISLYSAYALCRGFDLSLAKYIMINDAVSIRSENILDGFSLSIVNHATQDFQNAMVLALLRDPRAQFASTRHQMINELGNNYDLKFGNWGKAFMKLCRDDVSLNHGPAHFCMLYQVAAYRALMQAWRRDNKLKWIFLKNEDFNINFVATMRAFCKEVGIILDKEWLLKGQNYKAMMMGRLWAGTGAYSSRYQDVVNGPLSNDTNEQVKITTGPNKYVTERWKSRIPKHEQILLEHYFRKEISDLGYQFMFDKDSEDRWMLFFCTLLPWSGEFPNFSWVNREKNFSKKMQRVFYMLTFLPFYILARVKIWAYDFRDNFFEKDFPLYKKNQIPFIIPDEG